MQYLLLNGESEDDQCDELGRPSLAQLLVYACVRSCAVMRRDSNLFGCQADSGDQRIAISLITVRLPIIFQVISFIVCLAITNSGKSQCQRRLSYEGNDVSIRQRSLIVICTRLLIFRARNRRNKIEDRPEVAWRKQDCKLRSNFPVDRKMDLLNVFIILSQFSIPNLMEINVDFDDC